MLEFAIMGDRFLGNRVHDAEAGIFDIDAGARPLRCGGLCFCLKLHDVVDCLARDATEIARRDQSCGSSWGWNLSWGWNRMVCYMGVEIIIRFDCVGRRCV
jgi:hypothetical protein